MSRRVLVFAEDVLGMTLARDLCDRVVVERGPDWLSELWRDPKLRDAQREWLGVERGDPHPWTTWSAARTLAVKYNVAHALGGLDGYGLVAYRTARLAVHLAAKLQPAPDLVFFCLDTQGKEDLAKKMRKGLELAGVDGLPITLAVMHQEAEAWVAAGFVPENNAEKATLQRLVAEHGFDPTLEPHRLTPNSPTDPHDAKRVCKPLLPQGTVSARAQRCWLDTPLDELERRGAKTGLPEYLADVAKIVLPALGALAPREGASARGRRRGTP